MVILATITRENRRSQRQVDPAHRFSVYDPVADEDQFENFWNRIRPKRGIPVERPDLSTYLTNRLERAVNDPDRVPLVSPAQTQISQAVHRRVQAITTRVLNNYIGPVTDDTVLRLLYEVGVALATGEGADVEQTWSQNVERTTELTEPVRGGLGELLTHAGVVEASLDQNFIGESRTMTLTFAPQLGDVRVASNTDRDGRTIVSMVFDLGGIGRSV